MKDVTAKTSIDMLHKIESIEKEVMALKVSVLKKLNSSGQNLISFKGIIKGVDISEQDISAAKESLYSKQEL